MCVREGVVLLDMTVLLCTQATENLSTVQGPRRWMGLGGFSHPTFEW